METKSLTDVVVLILSYLTVIVAFLKALLIPVAPAAVVIAFIIDQGLKRLPFWKDGWAGYASLILNMVFSALLFVASQLGQAQGYLDVVSQLGIIFTLLLTIGGGFLITGKAHAAAVDGGIGKSLTEEHYAKLYPDILPEKAAINLNDEVTVAEPKAVNDGPASS